MRSKLKGVSPIISSILIVGVLATVTGVAYQWGLPIIRKNLDIKTLTQAEDFLKLIDKKIDSVAVSGGTEELTFNLPGKILIDPEDDKIELSFETSGSIYAPGGFVCFSRDCNLVEGTWGKDSYSVRGAKVEQSDEYYTRTIFSITQRNLTSPEKTYRIDIVTPGNATISGGENSRLIISKEGEGRYTKIRNNGIIHGASWTGGKYGSALEFDGSDDYVEVPDSDSLDITDAITIEAWVKFDKITDWDRIVGKYIGSCTGPYRLYSLELSNTQKFSLQFSNGTSSFGLWGNTTIQTGTWYHVVGTYDKNTGVMRIYVNGKLDAEDSTTSQSRPIGTNNYSVTIGGDATSGGCGEYSNATIDEVAIYNRALSATEIQEHYSGIFNNGDGLVALWHMDEGSGNTIIDNSFSGDMVKTTINIDII